MTRYTQFECTAAATLVVLSMVAAVTVVGAGALAVGTQEAAASHGAGGNYSVVLPEESDHLPGSENPEGASVHHLAAIEGGLQNAPADRYEVLEWLVISSEEIDFSGCETQDTAGLGIDRGNNNSGTQFDDDLIQHRKDSAFLDSKIWVQFYSASDFAGDTIGITDEDAIVAIQTDCYTMPDEPGWYQINGKVNGTGPDGEFFETSLTSHYFPVCEGCHDQATAEEKLGPAPSSDGGTDATPTPTPPQDDSTPTPAPGGDDPTPTDEPADGSTPTPAPGGNTNPSSDPSGDESNGGGANDGDTNGGDGTPTPGAGPGFTGLTALLALLAAALVVRRR